MEISQTLFFWAPFAAEHSTHNKKKCKNLYNEEWEKRKKEKCGGGYGKFTHKIRKILLKRRKIFKRKERERDERKCCQGCFLLFFVWSKI